MPGGGQAGRGGQLRGLQAEVLLGLGLVMAMATCVLVGVGLRLQQAQVSQLRELAAQRVASHAQAPGLLSAPAGSEWWRVDVGGGVRGWGSDAEIDPETRSLAETAAREREALLQLAAPWEPLRFAVPDEQGSVVVLRLPPATGLPLVAGLAVGCVTVLTAFGAAVLRGRVVGPLQRLASGVRAAADVDLETRLPEEGVRETAEVAQAFNEMAETLAGRTHALEKAVSELRQSNRSLRAARDGLDRAERLAAVGELASGVAHEVGNPVGALLAFLELLGRESELSEAGRAHLEKARQQGERVRTILRELLDFSRPARGEPAAVDLAELARGTLELVRPQRRYAGIRFSVEVEPETPRAWVDRGAVTQALLNLVINAADAVRADGGGAVTVLLRPGPVELRQGEEASAAAGRRRSEGVELRVEDDGPGIPEELRERIFDPFFSTKEPGEGTGLGLANTLRAAEQQGGRLDLETPESGCGACFVLRLPAQAAGSPAGIRSSGSGS